MKTPRWTTLTVITVVSLWLSGALLLPTGAPEWQIGLLLGVGLVPTLLAQWGVYRAYLRRPLHDRSRFAYRAVHMAGPGCALVWVVVAFFLVGRIPGLQLGEVDVSNCVVVGTLQENVPSLQVDVGQRVVAVGDTLYACPSEE